MMVPTTGTAIITVSGVEDAPVVVEGLVFMTPEVITTIVIAAVATRKLIVHGYFGFK